MRRWILTLWLVEKVWVLFDSRLTICVDFIWMVSCLDLHVFGCLSSKRELQIERARTETSVSILHNVIGGEVDQVGKSITKT